MEKLTKVGLAYVLGLLVCCWSGTPGAFAQGVNRGDLPVASREQHSGHTPVWLDGQSQNVCRTALCHRGLQTGRRCACEVTPTRVLDERTFRVLRISTTVIVLHTGWDVGT